MSSKVILLLLLLKVSLSHLSSCEVSSINQLSGERTEYNIRFPNVHTSMVRITKTYYLVLVELNF